MPTKIKNKKIQMLSKGFEPQPDGTPASPIMDAKPLHHEGTKIVVVEALLSIIYQ
jgi:hypothetical protein